MAARRVFTLWIHPLFLDSIRQLLRDPGIEWVGATSDHATALEQIARLQPDTILIEEAGPANLSAEVVGIMDASSSDVRIIRLSLTDNKLTLYHREQRIVAQADDLLRLVERDLAKGDAIEEQS